MNKICAILNLVILEEIERYKSRIFWSNMIIAKLDQLQNGEWMLIIVLWQEGTETVIKLSRHRHSKFSIRFEKQQLSVKF